MPVSWSTRDTIYQTIVGVSVGGGGGGGGGGGEGGVLMFSDTATIRTIQQGCPEMNHTVSVILK